MSFIFLLSKDSLTPNGDSPDRPISSEPSPGSSISDFTEKLTIIAEPFYGSKLRYRSDFQANQNRLGTLKNRTKYSSYQGPAIRVRFFLPQIFSFFSIDRSDSSTIFTKQSNHSYSSDISHCTTSANWCTLHSSVSIGKCQ